MSHLLLAAALLSASPPDTVVLSRAEFERLGVLICGPEGFIDWTSEGPTCARNGWSLPHGRYVRNCESGQDYRCGRGRLEQPWFCEDYLADQQPPFPGCKREKGRR